MNIHSPTENRITVPVSPKYENTLNIMQKLTKGSETPFCNVTTTREVLVFGKEVHFTQRGSCIEILELFRKCLNEGKDLKVLEMTMKHGKV